MSLVDVNGDRWPESFDPYTGIGVGCDRYGRPIVWRWEGGPVGHYGTIVRLAPSIPRAALEESEQK